jgi:hypothetical protein
MEIFINNQIGIKNNDLDNGKSLEYYLDLTKNWKDPYPEFVVRKINGFNIIDESVLAVGSKARMGDFFISQIKEKELVYVAPRYGMAGISLLDLASRYNKKVTLFMPSSKVVSEHQQIAIERGANVKFRRIAAMPNLNLMAKKYAKENGAYFIPLGLKHEHVTAGAVRCFYDFFKDKEKPSRMFSVISTGVLTRALQIALPDTEFHAVAVARNIQDGELGRAKFYSYTKPFSAKSKLIPTEFDSTENYDAKAWDFINKYGQAGDWLYNVAGNIKPIGTINLKDIDSQRNWNEIR